MAFFDALAVVTVCSWVAATVAVVVTNLRYPGARAHTHVEHDIATVVALVWLLAG